MILEAQKTFLLIGIVLRKDVFSFLLRNKCTFFKGIESYFVVECFHLLEFQVDYAAI